MTSVNFKNSMGSRGVWAAVGVTALALCASQQASAQAGPTFTVAQAEKGKTAYTQSCERCHGKNLDDGEFGPPLSGKTFTGRWAGLSRICSVSPRRPCRLIGRAHSGIRPMRS